MDWEIIVAGSLIYILFEAKWVERLRRPYYLLPSEAEIAGIHSRFPLRRLKLTIWGFLKLR
jgi:hypothetical protein